MKWPRRMRADTPEPNQGETEARKALRKADQRVHQAEEGNPEVTTVVRTLKRYGERNNFADVIHRALGGT